MPLFSYVGDSQRRQHNKSKSPSQQLDNYQTKDPYGGDIFTRVAIPRSGSFLNTSGLTRYKSRATRRAAGCKNGGGGGGGGGGYIAIYSPKLTNTSNLRLIKEFPLTDHRLDSVNCSTSFVCRRIFIR